MPYRPSQFQSTVIKPYYKNNSFKPLQDVLENVPDNTLKDVLENVLKDVLEDALEENYDQYALEGDYDSDTIVVDIPQPRRGRGCLKGLRNCQYLVNFKEQFVATIESKVKLLMAFMTAKEKADFKLTKQL